MTEYFLISKEELDAIVSRHITTKIEMVIRSRPAPSRNILDTDLCVCGLTEEECQAEKATIRNQTLEEVIRAFNKEDQDGFVNMVRAKRIVDSLRSPEVRR